MRHRSPLPFAAVLALPLCVCAHAQTAPDAGSLQREAEKTLHPPSARPQKPKPPAKPLAEDESAARVTVKRFVIEGASLVPVPELEALLAELPGHALSLAELERAAQRLAAHYRQRGWFVRVYLPEQDASAGTITLRVVEARFGGTRRSAEPTRANAAFIESLVTRDLKTGEPLQAARLERGLLLANDLAGVHVTGVLEAGEQAGTTRLLLNLADTPWLSGDLGTDDYGVRSTGQYQAVAGLSLNDLSGYGDRLALRALAAARLHSETLSYVSALGGAGWRLGGHLSRLDYTLGERFEALDAAGRATTGGLDLSYALWRQSERNLSLSAAADHRSYADDAQDTALRRHAIDALTLLVAADRSDEFLGGGVTSGSLVLVRGRLALHEIASDLRADAAGPRSAGQYTKFSVSLDRRQRLGEGWLARAALNAQLSDRNLASSEQMSLGGPNAVRAYPLNEATGDEGALLRLDLSRPLGPHWQGSLFYDAGVIRLHRHRWEGWNGNGGQPNGYALSGYGLGLSWFGPGGWSASGSAAKAFGHNPGRSSSGLNNDGSRPSDPRLWITLSKTL